MKLAHNVSCCIRLMTVCIVLLLLSTAAHADGSNLTITKDGTGSGTVRSLAGGIDCGDICSTVFNSVESAYLTAIPDPGSYFTGWSGGCSGQALTCAVAMTFDTTVTASFSTTPPTVTNWVKRFDMNLDAGNAILQTRDGGYVVAGRLNGQFVYPGLFSVIRLNTAGDIVWKKHYEGTASSEATSIREDAYGNFIVGGRYLGYNSSYNPMILRIDSNGDLLNAKYLNTSSNGAYSGIINGLDLDNTGVVMAGYVQYPEAGNNNIHLWIGEMTFIVDPILPQESPRWQIAMGGDGSEAANAVRMTSDGGSIVAGETTSFGAGGSDAWLIKLQGGGAIDWQKTYGGSGYDAAKDIRPTTDGGFVVAGATGSPIAGPWVAKLDSAGNIEWQNVYGYGEAKSIQQTIDGGYIVAGGTVLSTYTGSDAWLMKLNADGSVAWRRTYGSAGEDDIRSVVQSADGGYILTGRYNSSDMLVLKTDESGNAFGCGLGLSAVSSSIMPVTATAVASPLANNRVTINTQPGFNGTYPYSIGDMYPLAEDITLTGSGTLCSGAGPAMSVTPMVLVVSLQTPGYNIGATRAYTHKTQIVTIANNGNLPLNISSFAKSGVSPSFSISSSGGSRPCNTFSRSIAAGDYCTATIDYYPTAVGSNYGDFRLISNDPNRPDITMRFAGTCAVPILQTSASVQFGLLHAQSQSSTQILTLKNINTSSGDIQVGTVAISGTNADEFALVNNNCSAELAPQATCTLEVSFTPKAAGSRTASLSISSNDPISPLSIPLHGIGGYLLTVINQDIAGGTVTDSVGEGDPNIDCGSSCSFLFNDVRSVTLNATPVSGFQFSGWSGEGCSGTGTCTVDTDQDRTVTAAFTGGDLLQISFNPLASGSGIVTMTSPVSTSFNTDFQTHIMNQSTVSLTGEPDQFSIFTGWSGGVCSGTADCQFTINGTTTVIATFDFDAAHMIYNPDRDIYYSSLQTAYDEALDGNQILVWGVEHAETLTCGQPNGQQKNVTIKGGYDQGYTATSGNTALKGKLTITQGKVVAENLIIK